MKKIFLGLIIFAFAMVLTGCIVQGNSSFEPSGTEEIPVDTVQIEKGFAVETADIWTPTFQLCWMEFIKVTGTPKIEYVDGNPPLADELNKQKFLKSDLSEEDYYISVDKATPEHKKRIEKTIWKKFREKSNILDKIQYENEPTNKWLFYSMLIKKFPFIAQFDNLPDNYFDKDENQKYKYFGFMKNIAFNNEDSSENRKELMKTIEPLFYANDNDFALKIQDKTGKEEMILYLTESNASFDKIYEEIKEKSSHKEDYTQERIKNEKKKYKNEKIEIVFNDFYKVPYLHINENLDLGEELANKMIKDKEYPKYYWVILKALQTIKFDMDNKGAKLKSEALILAAKENSMMAEPIRHIVLDNFFYFDRPFIIFLKETDKNKPYFAARIKDGKYLVKE